MVSDVVVREYFKVSDRHCLQVNVNALQTTCVWFSRKRHMKEISQLIISNLLSFIQDSLLEDIDAQRSHSKYLLSGLLSGDSLELAYQFSKHDHTPSPLVIFTKNNLTTLEESCVPSLAVSKYKLIIWTAPGCLFASDVVLLEKFMSKCSESIPDIKTKGLKSKSSYFQHYVDGNQKESSHQTALKKIVQNTRRKKKKPAADKIQTDQQNLMEVFLSKTNALSVTHSSISPQPSASSGVPQTTTSTSNMPQPSTSSSSGSSCSAVADQSSHVNFSGAGEGGITDKSCTDAVLVVLSSDSDGENQPYVTKNVSSSNVCKEVCSMKCSVPGSMCDEPVVNTQAKVLNLTQLMEEVDHFITQSSRILLNDATLIKDTGDSECSGPATEPATIDDITGAKTKEPPAKKRKLGRMKLVGFDDSPVGRVIGENYQDNADSPSVTANHEVAPALSKWKNAGLREGLKKIVCDSELEVVDVEELTNYSQLDIDSSGETGKESNDNKYIREIRNTKDEELHAIVNRNEPYLREIFQGKRVCKRHDRYNSRDRKYLPYELLLGYMTYDQCKVVLNSLTQMFCKHHEKYMDYLSYVLLPEAIMKVHMDIFHWDYDTCTQIFHNIKIKY